MNKQWLLLKLAVLLSLASPATSAFAASGNIHGSIWLWNHNGNWCPSNANCTGSAYPSSVHENWEPVRNAKIEVHIQNGGALVGQGYSDDNGNFSLTWNITSGPVGPIELEYIPVHRDNRFKMATTSGSIPVNLSGPYSVTNGSSTDAGEVAIGTSSSPNPYWNAYWAAERLWRESFAYMGVFDAYFTNVEIRGFANTISGFIGTGTCNTSCADGATKRVHLDANAAYSPQARVMHEMGHVGDYVMQSYKFASNYCYPSTSGTCGWTQSSAEWGASGFEEAMATLGGSTVFWWPDAVAPTTCLSGSACYNSSGAPLANTNIETTSYPYDTNNCVTDEGRWPISHMRFQWDLYDDHDDAAGDQVAEGWNCYWCLFSNLNQYASGTSTNQINEPWNSGLSSIDNQDGRGSASWHWNYQQHFITYDWLWEDNCSPP